MKRTLYKDEIGKKEILELYDKKLNELEVDFKSIVVNTKFGKTNVIVCGDVRNPPLIVIHGSNGCAPIALETYPGLVNHFQVFAVDVLAQPNKSAETRLSMKDNSYGEWTNELIEQFNLNNVTLVGFSFGGLIILKTLLQDESKIKKVFLAAPAFVVNGNPLVLLLKVFIPMKMFMRTKKNKYLKSFLNALFTDKDEFAYKYLAKVFAYFKMDFTPVPVISKHEAMNITTPITLFAAKNDLMFPGEKMINRASNIFPSMKQFVLLKNSKHVQGKEDNAIIENIIINN